MSGTEGSALDALEASGLAYESEGTGPLTFVTGVAGLRSGPGEFWMLHVDGTLSPSGAGAAPVRRGSLVEWRLERTS